MTIITAITINAIIDAAVVYGLVLLLALGIRSDRQASTAQVRTLPQSELWRRAA